MQFSFTEDQQMIREAARGFLAGNAGVAHARKLMGTPLAHDAELWRGIVEQGWTGIALPESAGGSGLGMVELALVLEETGRGLYGGPFLASAGFAAQMLLEAPPSAARDALLARIADGSAIAALAVTGDSGAAGTAAVEAELADGPAGPVLCGHASFVLNGPVADVFVVVARDLRAGRNGSAVVAVEAGAAGLEVQPLTAMDLTRRYARLVFTDVAPVAMIADGSGADGTVTRGLQVAQVALAAEQLGAMQAAFDLARDYVGQRVQFGRKIGSFQAIKHRLADMMVVLEAARSAVYYAACVVDEHRSPDAALVPGGAPHGGSAAAHELAEAAAMVKVHCSAGFHDIAGNAIQLHGGIGFTWEYDVHLFFKRARATFNLLGPPQYHRERLAQIMGLDAPLEAP